MEMNYSITIKKMSTGEHRSFIITLTDDRYYKWRERMNKAEGNYVLTRIEIVR